MLSQQIINGLMLGSVYVLVAVAFTLSIGILNFLNFSIPGIFMIGGMVFWAMLKFGFGPLEAFAAGIVMAIIASMIVERLTYSWMKTSDPEIPLVSSLGFLILFEHLFLVEFGSESQTVPSVFPDANISAGGMIFGIGQIASLIVSVLMVFAINWFLHHTQTGRGIRAISEDTKTAEILGVEINKIVPIIFILSGVVAAIAGMLFALNYLQVSPFMGEELGMKGISAMIIGGMGNVWGAIAGGLLIGLAEVLSIHWLGSGFVDIAVYGLLLIILILRPQGLLGKLHAREKL